MSETNDHGQPHEYAFLLDDVGSRIHSGFATPCFEITGNPERRSLLLPLDGSGVVDTDLLQHVHTNGFEPKSEFHVTVLDLKPGTALTESINSLDLYLQEQIYTLIQDMSESGEWEVMTRDELFILEKPYPDETEPRRSVIQMIDCPNLGLFYAELNTLLPDDLGIEIPPAHITLATRGNPRGIGLSSHEDLELYGRRLMVFY